MPRIDQLRPRFAELWPELAKFGQAFGPARPKLANLGQSWLKFRQTRPRSGKIGQCWSKLTKMWFKLAKGCQCWPCVEDVVSARVVGQLFWTTPELAPSTQRAAPPSLPPSTPWAAPPGRSADPMGRRRTSGTARAQREGWRREPHTMPRRAHRSVACNGACLQSTYVSLETATFGQEMTDVVQPWRASNQT